MSALWVVTMVTAVLGAMVTESVGQDTRNSWGRRNRNPSPIAQQRTIVGLCKADLRTCPTISSRRVPVCTSCPTFETVSVNCPIWGVFEVQRVTACTCCRSPGVVIKGVVVDSVNAATRLPGLSVSIYGRRFAQTDANGAFERNVGSIIRSVLIAVTDASGNYISTVKVVTIPSGSKGPITVTIAMVKTATPIVIKATEDNTLSISSDPGSPSAGNAFIRIRAGTYRNRYGSTYRGDLRASLTYINTGDLSVETPIPGLFRTSWFQPLISDGIFALTVRAADGTRLWASRPMLVTVRSQMRLWSLSYFGSWTPLRVYHGRGRRQTSLTQVLASISDGQWVNIDRIPTAPRCYFKVRVFNENGGAEITSSQSTSFRPELLAYRVVESQRLRLYLPSTSSPSAECFEARCSNNAADLLAGFIGMKAYEDVIVNGVTIPIVQNLRPKALTQYSTAIQAAHGLVQYAIAPNQQDIFVNLRSSTTGPLYTSKSVCDNADITQPAFHFIKPDLPSYVPYPADVTECTARVYFTGTEFTDILANYTGPMFTIAAVSRWTQGGTGYYFTSTTTLQTSSNGGDYYYACLTYRCSKPSELTTINVDVDVPNIPGTNDPLFVCAVDGNGNGTPLDGSFVAPATVGTGTDYYGNTQNDCNSRAKNEAFAYIFKCFKLRITIS